MMSKPEVFSSWHSQMNNNYLLTMYVDAQLCVVAIKEAQLGRVLVQEDLEHLHEDDLGRNGSKVWNMAQLSMRARKLYIKNWKPTPLDLSYSGLEEFKQPEVNEYSSWDLSLKSTNVCDRESDNSKENTDDSLKQQQTVPETSCVKSSLKCNSQLNDKGFMDSRCSRHMSGNIAHLSDFKEFDGGYVTFGGGANEGKYNIKCFMKPFGCHVTILNTLDKLGKFDGKSDEGFFVGYSLSSKAFRVYNIRTRKVQENLHVGFLENKPMLEGNGQSGCIQGVSESSTSSQQDQDCIVMPIWKDASYFDDASLKSVDDAQIQDQDGTHDDCSLQNNGTKINTANPERLDRPIPTTKTPMKDQKIELGIFHHLMKFLPLLIQEFTKIIQLIMEDTRRPTNSLFACFLSQEEPKRVSKALSDPAWVEAMQEELLQFKLQNVWVLVDLPKGHRAIGTKTYSIEDGNDYDEVYAPVVLVDRGCFEDPNHPDKVYKVVKALYGLHQAPRAWYDTLTTYLLSNGFQRGQIDQNLFIKSQKGHILLVQIYVDDIIFGFTKKELCDEFEKLMKDKFQMSSMGELTFFLGLQVQQRKKGIFISQDKYVHEILRKFNYTDVKSASTPTDLEKPLVKDADADDVDEHLYRSMIGSLMYLTASRPDIMFAVCACARFQVSPKTSHLLAVKRIFRYLKGKPSLGLWYSKDSPLELIAYTDSDYAGATLDRKSTTGGCQFLGNRLISWQCKKQTVVATSTTEAEYVAAASCCGQVLWIQNQLLDYGYNFMNTVIYIDNTSTICIIENPVQHSKTKHIEIRHHFIRDCNTKKLIQMAKIDTQLNVADLLTKGFDAGRFQYLVSSIGMLNP
ncbi:putative ribonuclease H-like domain-containing protein [Tanacetum coccineum]|uniref:Ribonuclease H-like domain-containing protein n=1 Tax=Tanacetum coccineum TaxID=301880 RepID=A0ABQ5C510_9ASTR